MLAQIFRFLALRAMMITSMMVMAAAPSCAPKSWSHHDGMKHGVLHAIGTTLFFSHIKTLQWWCFQREFAPLESSWGSAFLVMVWVSKSGSKGRNLLHKTCWFFLWPDRIEKVDRLAPWSPPLHQTYSVVRFRNTFGGRRRRCLAQDSVVMSLSLQYPYHWPPSLVGLLQNAQLLLLLPVRVAGL